jgi:hypothetical protein
VLRSPGREFYSIGIERFIQRWQKGVESDETLWKNILIIAKKRERVIHINVSVAAVTFSKKKVLKALYSYLPS